MTFKNLDTLPPHGKRILTRVDLNVPLDNNDVGDDTRIRAVLPTIREISQKGGKVILLAHFGRPKGKRDAAQSLKPIAMALEQRLGQPVAFANDCVGAVAHDAIKKLNDGDVLLLENTRFHAGEEKNEPAFAQELAALGDVYVNDSFSTAHRAHASTEGIAHLLPSYAGRSMQAELAALAKALSHPERPVAAVVGGAKVSTKLELLGNLVARVNVLIIGGGMANTFLAARGVDVGQSLCEKDLLDTARQIEIKAQSIGCKIILPIDGVVATAFAAHAPRRTVDVNDVDQDEMILDIGPQTIKLVNDELARVKTLVWNGPFGAFELAPFDVGTVVVARETARLTKAGKLLSVAGGGDTVAALNHAGVADSFSYVSTAGGAFLEWLEGKTLPGVAALEQNGDHHD
jgi:phosphoglycerate kinase